MIEVFKKNSVHFALFTVSLMYATNYIVAKEVCPAYIGPFGMIVVRVFFAAILFWLTMPFFKVKEKIQKEDYGRLFLCACFGVATNQLLFFKGISLTKPINASIIMTTTPILVFIISAFLLKTKITLQKVIGLLLGTIGAMLLILKDDFGLSSDTFIGDLCVFLNAVSFGLYLVIVKPLMAKYNPLTITKWCFTLGFFMVIPFGGSEFLAVNWGSFPPQAYAIVTFIVIGVTFIAYMLNNWSLQRVNPTVVGSYIYLQPVLTTIIAVSLAKDSLDLTKILYALLIFLGVFLVSKK